MKLRIDRKIWLRGTGDESYLLEPGTGKMCCVGIYLADRGVPKDVLMENGSASSLPVADYILEREMLKSKVGWLLGKQAETSMETRMFLSTTLADSLYSVNDRENSYMAVDGDFSRYVPKEFEEKYAKEEREREAEIAALFKEAGIEVEFYN